MFLLFLSCEDEQDKYGALHIEINVTQDQGAAAAKIASGDIAKVTITISGMDPVSINVSSGTNVSRTIEDVPIGEQTVKVDLKNASGLILWTQTETVEVEAGKTASPIFNDFTPKNLSIAVTSPNGGETWQLGTIHNITWTSSHSSEPVTIDLNLNGSWADSIGNHINNTGSFSWGIPATINESNLYKIKISYSTVTTNDFSNGNFTLLSASSNPTITVTSPNGGENWAPGSSQEITWTSSGVGSYVNIFLYYFGDNLAEIVEISNATSNDGSYTWSIPSSPIEPGAEYYVVMVVDYYDADVYDLSDDYFTITQASGGSCNYSISLYDSYGDGWHGNNYVNLYINGSLYSSYTLSSGSGPATYTFLVDDGVSVYTTFTDGSFSSECSYYIYDSDGNEVASDGMSGNTPTGVSFTASCDGSEEEGLIFEDDFSGTLGWETDSYGSYQIVNGRLRISSGGDYSYQHKAYMDISTATEYSYVEPELEYIVDVDFVSGLSSEFYGIGFRDQYGIKYFFLIKSDGLYHFTKYDASSGGWTTLIASTSNATISNSGGDGELKLTYDNNQFNLYVDDEYLNSYSLSGKKFDIIYLYQQDDTIIDFDNVKLYGTLTD